MFAYTVINFAFSEDSPPFQAVVCHCLVLEINDRLIRIIRRVNLFSFSFTQKHPDLRHPAFLLTPAYTWIF